MLGWAAAIALAVPAAAQDDQARPRPGAPVPQRAPAKPAPRPKLGLQVAVTFEREAMTASQTFEATLGKASLSGWGAAGDVRHVWRNAFARVAVSRMSDVGTRAWVLNGTVIPLGIPLDLSLTNVEAGGGWRFKARQWPRVEFYGGASALFVVYREDSKFAQSSENSAETFRGSAVFAGVDVVIWKWVIAGAEFEYRDVGNALGAGGISQIYGERSLGGSAVRVLVGVRRQKSR